MGRGGGKGGGGGGGRSSSGGVKGGSGSGFQFRWLTRGLNRLFGPGTDTTDALRRVAIARGLRDVDELLASLGKQIYDVSYQESTDLLRAEVGDGEFGMWSYYKPGKGYRTCNRLLEQYLKGMKEKSFSSSRAEIELDHLMKYCSYTEDEVHSLM